MQVLLTEVWGGLWEPRRDPEAPEDFAVENSRFHPPVLKRQGEELGYQRPERAGAWRRTGPADAEPWKGKPLPETL